MDYTRAPLYMPRRARTLVLRAGAAEEGQKKEPRRQPLHGVRRACVGAEPGRLGGQGAASLAFTIKSRENSGEEML